MKRTHLYLLALGLTVFGLAIFLYKVLALKFPLIPETQADVWNVEARITFVALNKPVKVILHIPRNSKRFAILDESFISRGYGLTTVFESEFGNRQAAWSIRKAKGRQSLYYQGVVRRIQAKEPVALLKLSSIEIPKFEGPYFEAAEALIVQIREQSADSQGLVTNLVKSLNAPQPDQNVNLLLGKQPSLEKKVEVAVKILAQAGMPARAVQGLRLEEQTRDASVLQWLEFYDSGRWHSFDAATGNPEIPDNYLAWWRGPDPFAQLQGGHNLKIKLAASLNQEEAIKAAIERGKIVSPLLIKFSLFRLPIQTQVVYRVLLLIPVGAFLLVVLRNVVGVKTFGTFMPVLIALAFRETQLLWGIILFTLLVALGLGIRFYLEHLKLLLIPRLASVLIVVVLLMAVLSVFTHELGLERGLSVALFPMVILTMTIERMTVVWDELGAVEALKQGSGSLLIAALTYLIMTVSYVEHLTFVFPELLLVLLAGTILLGRYAGFRLLELWRFKALVKKEL